MYKPEIFLSYSRGGENESIVDQLDQAFQEKGITLIRDNRDIGFKGMITPFMQRLGEGRAVIAVISDKYLKSPYCMFEMIEIHRNLQFTERIFPILLDDANIIDPLERLKYLEYWKDKKQALDDAIRKFGTDAISVIGEDYKTYKKIFDSFGEIVNILKDINQLAAEANIAGNFNLLIEEVGKLVGPGTNQQGSQIEPIDWDFIVQNLKEEKSILFLGPEIYRTNDNIESQQQAFFEKLAAEHRKEILSYNKDGFFLFSGEAEKFRISLKIMNFFETLPESEIIRKIAEIPFHIIVSVNPDDALKQFFLEKKHPFSFNFYDRNVKKDGVDKPTIRKPLLYNLLGSITKPETLVLSHDDLFEYFKGLFGNNSLPEKLKTELNNANEFIFLGFQFDKWYVQLLLSLLNLHDKENNYIRYALANSMTTDTQSLCINHFRIEFIGTDNMEFINILHEKSQQAGLLRDFNTTSQGDSTGELLSDLDEKINLNKKLLLVFENLRLKAKDPRRIKEYKDKEEEIRNRIRELEEQLRYIQKNPEP